MPRTKSTKRSRSRSRTKSRVSSKSPKRRVRSKYSNYKFKGYYSATRAPVLTIPTTTRSTSTPRKASRQTSKFIASNTPRTRDVKFGNEIGLVTPTRLNFDFKSPSMK
jgi:hypothetical protein